MRVSKHCSEEATINDMTGGSTGGYIAAFRAMKGSDAALRNTADAAALLVYDFTACGVGYLNTFSFGATFTVTKVKSFLDIDFFISFSFFKKSCALGYYSFGHELGHNFGAHHNPEVATNTAYSYGHGHLIQQGIASQGETTNSLKLEIII